MLVRQSYLYASARIFAAAITFGLIAFYTRILSPDEYGIYTYVLAIVALLQGAGIGWLGIGALRLSEREGKRDAVLSTILVCFGVLTIIIALGTLALFLIEENVRNKWLLIIGALFVVIQGWYETSLSLLRARLQVFRYVLYTIARTVIASIFGAWFAWVGWGAEGILIGGIIGVLIPSLFLSFELWFKAQITQPHVDDMSDMIRFGMPLALGFTVGAIILVTDRFLIEIFLGVYLLGIYGAAYQIADRIMRSLIEPIGSAGLPLAINKLEYEGLAATTQQLRQNWSLLISVALPAVAGLCAVTPSLVEIVVGPDYRSGALEIIPPIAIATFLNGVRGGYLDHAYHLGQKTQLVVYQSICVAVINVVVTIPLILQYGILGAAYGSLFAQLTGVIFALIFGRLSFDLPLEIIDTAKVGIAATMMWLAVFLLPLEPGLATLITQVLFGASVFAAVMFLLGPFGLRDHVQVFLRTQLQRFG